MELIDIHCHLMPYVDDGAADIVESNELLYEEMTQGVREICVTPHLRAHMFRSSDDAVREGYESMLRVIEEEHFSIQLHLSREYYYDEDFLRLLKKDELIYMGPDRTVLTEFSYATAADRFPEAAEKILSAGYRPLFAHVERYSAVQKDPELIRELRDMGVLIQVNAASILRKEGWRQWFTARHLLNSGYVHVVASDAHNMDRRSPRLAVCAELLERKYGSQETARLLYDNPAAILHGGRVV